MIVLKHVIKTTLVKQLFFFESEHSLKRNKIWIEFPTFSAEG